MKRIPHYFILLTLALGLATTSATAQRYFEAGIQGGDMPYNGDLAETGFGFLSDWNTFGGVYLRYRPLTRLGLRVNGIFGRITASNTTRLRVSPDEINPVERNFRTKINEISLAAEIDLFYLGDPEDRFIAPYVMVGAGITSFDPQSERNGNYIRLQPLATEGQGLGGDYPAAPYDLSITTYHLGGGVRAKVSERIVLGLETSGRLTGTDYLDDISGRELNYLDVLSNAQNAELTGFFSNPGVEDPSSATEDFNYTRGGASDDFYFLINLTVGIRLGGFGRGGGSGCYSF